MKTDQAIQVTDAEHTFKPGTLPTGWSQTLERHSSEHGSIPQKQHKGHTKYRVPFQFGSTRLDDPLRRSSGLTCLSLLRNRRPRRLHRPSSGI